MIRLQQSNGSSLIQSDVQSTVLALIFPSSSIGGLGNPDSGNYHMNLHSIEKTKTAFLKMLVFVIKINEKHCLMVYEISTMKIIIL